LLTCILFYKSFLIKYTTVFKFQHNGKPQEQFLFIKKGDPEHVENYRPISNIFSLATVFEKLVLLRLKDLEIDFKVNLMGHQQQGFKRNHSSVTAGIELQSKISNRNDKNEYVAVASFDLSAAFDITDRGLLFKRMVKLGFPGDILSLLKEWLSDQYFYVEIENNISYYRKSKYGEIQGLVLGLILFNVFLRPIYNLAKLLSYADDNYLLKHDKDLLATICKCKIKSEFLLSWLLKSGLKVNESKTKICIFHRNDIPKMKVKIGSCEIETKMN